MLSIVICICLLCFALALANWVFSLSSLEISGINLVSGRHCDKPAVADHCCILCVKHCFPVSSVYMTIVQYYA